MKPIELNRDYKHTISQNTIAGYIAMWAVRQSPYPCPDDLETVVKNWVERTKSLLVHEIGEYFFKGTVRELREFLEKTLVEAEPLVQKWNERKNGKDDWKFTSSYDGPGDPDDDFIDLGALVRNITHSACIEDAEWVDDYVRDTSRLITRVEEPAGVGPSEQSE